MKASRLWALLLLSVALSALAQPYGLPSRPAVGPFLNRVLPEVAPTLSGNWSTVVAFSNLTFFNAVGLAPVPGTNRLAVWEREGRVYTFENNPSVSTRTLVLNITNQCQGWDDSGLLGVAFHPGFATNRYMFVWYNWVTPGTVQGGPTQRPPTATPNRDRLSRFTLDANGVAIPGSEVVFIDQNAGTVWHNGGGMFFHPDDGFLYITNGDDASGSNNQIIDRNLFSGVLRIDVDRRGGSISHLPPRRPLNGVTTNYFIPNDNPFVGQPNVLEEFFCIGLRSPHRMTIDPVTRRIFIGDVGEGSREEISVVEPGETGLNFQWNRIEGLNGDLTPPYIGVNKRPILDYTHSEGFAVIGGYVYRGTQFAADLGGKYIFGDNGSKRIWVMNESTTPATKTLLATLPPGPGPNPGNDYVGLSSFGVDHQGELYMCQMSSTGGRIYKLQRGGPTNQPLPRLLSQTGAFTNVATLGAARGLIPYDVASPLWSDGAHKSRWMAIPTNNQISFVSTGEWTFPQGSVFVKHFELSTNETNPAVRQRLETRLLVRDTNGYVYGATYKWRADNSDADLLDSFLNENIPIVTAAGFRTQTWYYPSRTDCLACHTAVSGGVLGVKTRQSNRDFFYPGSGVTDNQLRAWNHIGLFNPPISDESVISNLTRLVTVTNTSATLEHRVRSYLDANCAHCHRPGGVQAAWDARFDTPLDQQGIINGFVFNNLGNPANRNVVPANVPNSIMHRRVNSVDPAIKMPPLAKNIVDADAVAALTEWINSLPPGAGPQTLVSQGATWKYLDNGSNQGTAWSQPGFNDASWASGPAQLGYGDMDEATVVNGGPSNNRFITTYFRHSFNVTNASAYANILVRILRDDGAVGYLNGVELFRHNMPSGVINNTTLAASTVGDPDEDAFFDVPGNPAASLVDGPNILAVEIHQINNTSTDISFDLELIADRTAPATNTPPTVAITGPPDGASFAPPANITITANASDNGSVTNVEFYQGSTRIASDTVAPYSVTWSNVSAGAYSLSARAWDNTGLISTSAAVNITVAVPTNGTGLLADYYDNINFTAFSFSRVDAAINFDWGTGSPDPRLAVDTFSVRWAGSIKPRYSQTYTFYATADDGVRLWVNGQLIIDRWIDQPPTTWTGTISLSANQLYDIQMDYYENAGGAVARLEWSSTSQAREVVPQSQLFPPNPAANRRPNTPLITEPGTENQLVNPADVHMETSVFSDPDPGDQHVCSDFEIWTVTPAERVWVTPCIGGIEKTHTHLGDGIFEGSHAGRDALLFETDYRLRVRHRDNSGDPATEWSAWAERRFRTTSQIDPIPGAPGWIVRQPGYKVEVVATGFQLPVNIAFVPNPGTNANSPFYYVTELYGIIKVVTRDGTVRNYATNLLNFNPTGAFPGSGEQGLAGIVVDPATGQVYASLLYDAGGPHYPKVVRFTSTDGGLTAATMTTILDMAGEAQGQSHQISNLTIGPDGRLYVHMGDGFDAATAQNTNSFRGKILRMNLDGRPLTDNPFYNAANGTNAQDYIFAYGVRNPFGGDWRAADNMHYEVENGPSVDRFAKIVRGRNYLWNGTDASMANFAIYNWNPSVGPVNIAFIQANRFGGSGFPTNKFDHAFVSESGPTWASGPQSNGKRITEFVLDAAGNLVSGPARLIEYNGTGKASVVALAAGPDGLYFSDFYKDLNYSSPIDRGANILRVRWIGTNNAPAVALTAPADGATFRAGTNVPVTATAAGNGTNISLVEFFANAIKLGEDALSPYSLTWSNVPAGSYQLTAKATDARGLMSTSAVVSITVTTNALPAVAMTSPANGATFTAPAAIEITADANDSNGSVSRVDFYQGATRLGEDTASPYSLTWSNVPAGNYTLTAVATDNEGAVSTSAPVAISVVLPDARFTNTLVAAGALWRYLDDGSNQGTNWVALAFNDATWLNGAAQLGYGDLDEVTTVRSNRMDGTRIVTTYFRRGFNVTNALAYSNLVLRVLRDDGVLVFLNSAEVFRDNLPAGPVSYTNFATATINGAAESTFLVTNINPASLREGLNVVAAEIHQVNNTSSDISFDLELIGSGHVNDVPIRLFAERMTNGAFRLWFNAPGSHSYIIDAGMSLGTWSPVSTNTALSGQVEYVEPNMTPPRRFYRVRRAQ